MKNRRSGIVVFFLMFAHGCGSAATGPGQGATIDVGDAHYVPGSYLFFDISLIDSGKDASNSSQCQDDFDCDSWEYCVNGQCLLRPNPAVDAGATGQDANVQPDTAVHQFDIPTAQPDTSTVKPDAGPDPDYECVADDDCLPAPYCQAGACVDHVCHYMDIPNCKCQTNLDCDDQDLCTTDLCLAGKCVHPANSQCECQSDSACNDNDPCTKDSCVSAVCVHQEIENCCVSAGECDDGNPCTTDSCVWSQCQHSAVIQGCCQTAADCDDNNAGTTDQCVDNKCQHTEVANYCQSAADCNDGNPCTTDSCVWTQCQHSAVQGCCQTAADCDDYNECTIDQCVSNKCQHSPDPDCDPVQEEPVECSITCPSSKYPVVWTAWYDTEFKSGEKFSLQGCNLCAWAQPSFAFNCRNGSDYGGHELAQVSCTPSYSSRQVLTVPSGTVGMVIFDDLACEPCQGPLVPECSMDADCEDDDPCTVNKCNNSKLCTQTIDPYCGQPQVKEISCQLTCPGANVTKVMVWSGAYEGQVQTIANGGFYTAPFSGLCSWQWPQFIFNCGTDYLGTIGATVSCTPMEKAKTLLNNGPNGGQTRVDFDSAICL